MSQALLDRPTPTPSIRLPRAPLTPHDLPSPLPPEVPGEALIDRIPAGTPQHRIGAEYLTYLWRNHSAQTVGGTPEARLTHILLTGGSNRVGEFLDLYPGSSNREKRLTDWIHLASGLLDSWAHSNSSQNQLHLSRYILPSGGAITAEEIHLSKSIHEWRQTLPCTALEVFITASLACCRLRGEEVPILSEFPKTLLGRAQEIAVALVPVGMPTPLQEAKAMLTELHGAEQAAGAGNSDAPMPQPPARAVPPLQDAAGEIVPLEPNPHHQKNEVRPSPTTLGHFSRPTAETTHRQKGTRSESSSENSRNTAQTPTQERELVGANTSAEALTFGVSQPAATEPSPPNPTVSTKITENTPTVLGRATKIEPTMQYLLVEKQRDLKTESARPSARPPVTSRVLEEAEVDCAPPLAETRATIAATIQTFADEFKVSLPVVLTLTKGDVGPGQSSATMLTAKGRTTFPMTARASKALLNFYRAMLSDPNFRSPWLKRGLQDELFFQPKVGRNAGEALTLTTARGLLGDSVGEPKAKGTIGSERVEGSSLQAAR